jgi:hypothetical protein
MKTKLLKKIRKRLSIIRIDKLASDAGETLQDNAKIFGMPFFQFKDSWDSWGYYSRCFRTFEEAKEFLWKYIIKEYSEKFRHEDKKSTKV